MTRFPWGALLCVASVLGCDSLLGVRQLPAGNKCAYCAAQACGAELDACNADPDCARMYAKLAACPVDDPECRHKAEGRALRASTLPQAYRELDTCRRNACLDDCYGTSGLAPAMGAACIDCLQNSCASNVRTCVGGTLEAGADPSAGDCERFAECVAGADVSQSTPNQWLSCEDGRNRELLGAGVSACGGQCTSCPQGHDFSCVDNWGWQSPEGGFPQIDTRLHLTKDGTAPVTTTAVEADWNCDPAVPWAKATTDADGFADLMLQSNFRGCFRISAPTSDYATFLMYVERPLETFQDTLAPQIWATSKINKVLAPHTAFSNDTGLIFAYVLDCWYSLAEGIEIKTTNLSPAPPTVEKGRQDMPTTPGHQVYVYVLDVPPGPVDLEATFQGRPVAHASVRVEAGKLTTVQMYPDTR